MQIALNPKRNTNDMFNSAKMSPRYGRKCLKDLKDEGYITASRDWSAKGLRVISLTEKGIGVASRAVSLN